MKKFIALIFVFMFLLSISFCIEVPDLFYFIQIGSYFTINEAQAQKGIIEQAGYSPVTIITENDSFQISFGEFEYYVDALRYKNQIEKSYSLNCKILSATNKEKNSLKNTVGPIDTIFKMQEKNMSEVPDIKLNESDPLVIEINSLMNGPDKDLYRKKLAEAINSLPDTDIRKGFVLTRKGILELLDKNFDEALSCLKKVANGEVTATRVDRIKSIRRVAWIMHQQKDRLGAYKAYREMESFTGSDYSRVMAKVECAGLLMELARCDKGPLSDCRRECEKIKESIPAEYIIDPDYKLQLAITELMHLEAWFYEGKFQKCLEESEVYLTKYEDTYNREKAVCKTFLGICYYKIGNYNKAVEILSQVINMDIQRKWQAVDSKKNSLDILIRMAKEEEDNERLTQWEILKQQLYSEQ